MGQLGVPELAVIFIIALLVFGPKKLPELGKSLGKGLREFRRATDDIKSTWKDQLNEVEKTVDEVKSTVSEAANQIKPDLDLNPSEPETRLPQTPPSDAAREESTDSSEVHKA